MISISKNVSFIALLSFLFFGQLALAQERIAVFLPTDIQYDEYNKMTSLHFNGMPPLPKNSFLNGDDEKMLLNLTIKENRLPENKTCYIELQDVQNKNVTTIQIKGGTSPKTIVAFDIPSNEFEKLKNGVLSFKLKYKEDCFEKTTTHLITFYDNENLIDTVSLNNQPKLTINYELRSKPHRSDWSQPYGDPQQTNSLDWTLDYKLSNGEVTYPFVISGKLANNAATLNKDKISIYKKNPITYTTNGSSTVISLWPGDHVSTSYDWVPIWTKSIPYTAPKQLPLITENGYMYYFSGGNDQTTMMVVLDLKENGREIDAKNLNELKIGNGKMSKIENTITMGYDGSLYIPTNTGIVAVTPYPELKPKWYYNAEGNFGPVSLSKDERLACFILKTSKQTELCVIDNITGKKLGSHVFDGKYMDNGRNDLPPILIQTMSPTEEFNALILNKSNKATGLLSFKINYSKLFTISKNNIEGINENAILSQLVLTQIDNKAYVFDSTKQEILIIDTNQKIERIKSTHTVLSDETYLGCYNNSVPLIISNIKNDNRKRPLSSDIAIYTININRPFFSSDGTFYAVGVAGDLRHYFPQLYIVSNSSGLNIPELKNKTTYGHERKIEIAKQDVGPTINSILWSKEFVFKKGFTVKKGASLTFQIIK